MAMRVLLEVDSVQDIKDNWENLMSFISDYGIYIRIVVRRPFSLDAEEGLTEMVLEGDENKYQAIYAIQDALDMGQRWVDLSGAKAAPKEITDHIGNGG